MALRHADALTPAHCPDCCGRAPPRLCTVRRSLPTSSCPSTGCRRVRDCDDRPPERGGLAEASPLNNRRGRQPHGQRHDGGSGRPKACPSCGRCGRHSASRRLAACRRHPRWLSSMRSAEVQAKKPPFDETKPSVMFRHLAATLVGQTLPGRRPTSALQVIARQMGHRDGLERTAMAGRRCRGGRRRTCQVLTKFDTGSGAC